MIAEKKRMSLCAYGPFLCSASKPRIRRPAISCVRHGSKPVLPQLVDAVFLQRGVVLARQVLERIRAVGVQIEEVVRRLLGEARVAPQIGVDRALDDERPVRLEERAERLGQHVDGARDDELVRLESPRAGGRRHEQDRGQQAEQRRCAYLIIAECLVSAPTCRSRAACRSPIARAHDPSVRDASDLQQEREPVARAAAAARRDRGIQGRREEDRHLDPIVAHASYLINIATDERGAARAIDRRARRRGRSRRGAGTAGRRPSSGRPDDRPADEAHLASSRRADAGARRRGRAARR